MDPQNQTDKGRVFGGFPRAFWIVVGLAAAVALAVSLIPMLILGQYAGPSAEDYIFGGPVHFTLKAGKGFPDVLTAVWENIAYNYLDWQGTFASIALFSLEPGVFSEDAYVVTPYVFLALLLASFFVALGSVRGVRGWKLVFLGSVAGFLAVQFLPSVSQGLYWWNGASHYLFFWFLSVLDFTWQVRLTRKEGKGKGFWGMLAVGCLFSFLIGGGNFCTALVFPLCSFCLTACAFWKKRPFPVRTGNLLMALFGLSGLTVSMLAPGNALRQAGYEPLSPLPAIGLSFQYAWEDLLSLLDWKLLGALLLCVPVFLSCVRESGYRFPFPPLILLGSFCAYAALYAPVLYSMGDGKLPPRVQNLLYVAGLFLIFGNAFYLAGWAFRRFSLPDKRWAAPALAGTMAAGVVLFSVSALLQVKTSNAYRTYRDLRSPALTACVEERAGRQAVYGDKSISTPRFQPLSRPPESFYLSWVVTWNSDVLLDGEPTDLQLYRGRDGNVTFIELDYGLSHFGAEEALTPSDFSVAFHVRDGDYVPLRELCGHLGIGIEYALADDTIRLTRETGEESRAS